MDFTSLLTSLGTSFLIFLLLVFAFTWLSKMQVNRVIYFPNKIVKGLDVSTKSRNPFAWIVETWQATEDEIISVAGLDAAVYLIFITTGYDDFDRLAMGNIQKKSSRLWGFAVAAYWVSFVTYFLLWKTYNHVLRLRRRGQASLESKPEQFVVLVRDIPPVPVGTTLKEHVDSFFMRLYPETFGTSLIVTDISEVHKVWKKLEGYKKSLARAEVIFEKSKTRENPEGILLSNKTGILGLWGPKVDSIDFYKEKIKDLSDKLQKIQQITLRDKQVAAAFIIFNSRCAAATASQAVLSHFGDRWTVMAAPEPRQILWKNLAIPFYQRMIREKIVYIIMFLAIVFYMVPVTFICALTTLDNLRKLLPFLTSVVDIKAVKSILEAYLPQLVLLVFLAFLPTILMILSRAEGIPSEGHVVRASSGKYFYFIVFNIFLGVTLGGTLFESLKAVEKQPNSIVTLLGNSLPPNATFFISFVALKFFVGYGLELSRLVSLVIYHIKRKFLCKTDADVEEAWAPGGFGYATRVPNDMLIITIALCYSVIAPMILPFASVYFIVGWFVLRNQALNVYVASYESNGNMWPHMHTRILSALFLSQITMIGFFSIKEFYYSPLLLPLLLLTLVFGHVCKKRFYISFGITSREVTSMVEASTPPSLSSVVEAFTPPSLSSVVEAFTPPCNSEGQV